MLSKNELERYDRQTMITGFGESGQEQLKQTRVLIAGAGGLGSPVSIYLAAAGIGAIRIVDHGDIELSNMNRQILHWTEDIGRAKVASAKEKLKKLNPNIELEVIRETITEENINELAKDCNLIVDAMDNLPARFLLNKAALDYQIPLFHGAAYGFEGRAMTIIPGKTACLGCLYKGIPPAEKFPVAGTAPGVIGCIQAAEVIKYVVGIGELLADKLLIYDGLTSTFTTMHVSKDAHCLFCADGARKE